MLNLNFSIGQANTGYYITHDATLKLFLDIFCLIIVLKSIPLACNTKAKEGIVTQLYVCGL